MLPCAGPAFAAHGNRAGNGLDLRVRLVQACGRPLRGLVRIHCGRGHFPADRHGGRSRHRTVRCATQSLHERPCPGSGQEAGGGGWASGCCRRCPPWRLAADAGPWDLSAWPQGCALVQKAWLGELRGCRGQVCALSEEADCAGGVVGLCGRAGLAVRTRVGAGCVQPGMPLRHLPNESQGKHQQAQQACQQLLPGCCGCGAAWHCAKGRQQGLGVKSPSGFPRVWIACVKRR